MGCQNSKDVEGVILPGECQEFPAKRRRSLSQILFQPGRSENMHRDVFSIFAERGMSLESDDAHSPSSVNDSPFSSSGSVISTATTASLCERTTIHGLSNQTIPKLNISYGSFSDKGKRKSNEDRKVSTLKMIHGEPVAYFGIYDGHGGEKVSEYLSQHLHRNIFANLKKKADSDLEESIVDAFAATDESIFAKQIDSGSTAVSVVVRGSSVVVASIGDSQAVLSSEGKARDLCVPHTPNLSTEKARILAAKGTVVRGRIFGVLGVSRAFGDNDFKTSRGQFKDRFNGDLVTSSPDLVHHEISESDEFVVMGCDGLFDVMKPQQVVDFIKNKLAMHGEVQQAAEELVTHAINIGSTDNVSAIVVCLNHHQTESLDEAEHE